MRKKKIINIIIIVILVIYTGFLAIQWAFPLTIGETYIVMERLDDEYLFILKEEVDEAKIYGPEKGADFIRQEDTFPSENSQDYLKLEVYSNFKNHSLFDIKIIGETVKSIANIERFIFKRGCTWGKDVYSCREVIETAGTHFLYVGDMTDDEIKTYVKSIALEYQIEGTVKNKIKKLHSLEDAQFITEDELIDKISGPEGVIVYPY